MSSIDLLNHKHCTDYWVSAVFKIAQFWEIYEQIFKTNCQKQLGYFSVIPPPPPTRKFNLILKERKRMIV